MAWKINEKRWWTNFTLSTLPWKSDLLHMNRGMCSKRKIFHDRTHGPTRTSQPASQASHLNERTLDFRSPPPSLSLHCSHNTLLAVIALPRWEKGFCVLSGRLRQQPTSYHTSCGFLAQQIKSYGAAQPYFRKLPIPPGRDVLSTDQVCPIIFRAKLSTLCPYFSEEDPQSTTHRRCPGPEHVGQPQLSMSQETGSHYTGALSAAIGCKPIEAHALSASAGTKGPNFQSHCKSGRLYLLCGT